MGVEDWIYFHMPADVARVIAAVRRGVRYALDASVHSPGEPLSPECRALVAAVCQVVEAGNMDAPDGMGGGYGAAAPRTLPGSVATATLGTDGPSSDGAGWGVQGATSTPAAAAAAPAPTADLGFATYAKRRSGGAGGWRSYRDTNKNGRGRNRRGRSGRHR